MFRTDRVRYPELESLLNRLVEEERQILQIIPTNEGEHFVVISIEHQVQNFSI